MCKDNVRVSSLRTASNMWDKEGDEVWEANSESDTESEVSECESEVAAKPVAASKVPARHPTTPMASPLVVHSAKQAAPQLPSIRIGAPKVRAAEAWPPASRQQTLQVQEGGLMSLVSHLRRDNGRLREALVAAQRETEEAVLKGEERANVDFGHLLELVRDFGDDLGAVGEGVEDAPSDDCSPHGAVEQYSLEEADNEEEILVSSECTEQKDTARLRLDLDSAQQEILRLKKELAAKDEELAALRRMASGA